MSRGLGKIEREVLRILQEEEKENAVKMYVLLCKIYQPEHYNRDPDSSDVCDYFYENTRKPTNTERATLSRTIKRLEKKGLIHTSYKTELLKHGRYKQIWLSEKLTLKNHSV